MLINPKLFLMPLLFVAVTSLYLALAYGSFFIAPKLLWHFLTTSQHSLEQQIFINLRLPRAINAFTVGAMLALSGNLMQILLQNPLADPYVLGTSGGASCGALLVMLLGGSTFLLNCSAILGAILAITLLFMLNRGRFNNLKLLLSGVILASGFSAIISFILTISPDKQLHSMLFWLMGDLTNANHGGLCFSLLSVAMLISFSFAKQLNCLTRGEWVAKSQGINTNQLFIILFLISSILTASSVISAGSIGFVGLVVPHLLRLLGCHDQKYLIPGVVLAGGSLLCLADLLSRTLVAPLQLPVGIITTLIGVPIFLVLLMKGRVT